MDEKRRPRGGDGQETTAERSMLFCKKTWNYATRVDLGAAPTIAKPSKIAQRILSPRSQPRRGRGQSYNDIGKALEPQNTDCKGHLGARRRQARQRKRGIAAAQRG